MQSTSPTIAINDLPDRLLPFSTARAVVGISRSKIYLLLEQRAFPQPVKVGRSNFFSERELQCWIHSRLESRQKLNVEK